MLVKESNTVVENRYILY